MERLQPAILTMCDVVERFGGTVVRTLGDGVMAIFGVPHALEQHAELACAAALHLQTCFPAGPQGLRIRVGLHSGQVASDPKSADGSKGGGAHGLSIHLASRVMSLAEPGMTLISAECRGLVRAAFDARSLGHQMLKGLIAPVEVYVLTAARSGLARQQFHQSALAGFYGRDEELTRLQQALLSSVAGQAQVVGIAGAPGTGKSRLCHELARWAQARGIPVFEIRAQHHGDATPLQPVIELLRGYVFRIHSSDDVSLARRRVEERLAEIGVNSEQEQRLLEGVLGLADTSGDNRPKVGQAPRTRLVELMGRLVRHVATESAVLILEDLHWLDEASEAFLTALVEAIESSRTLLLLNYRPAFLPPWTGRDNFHQIELGELPSGAIDALVRDLIRNRPEVGDIAQLVARRSGGNPFFAEELVRSLAESGMLSGDDPSGLEALEHALPATVQAVISARIDRLAETEKNLLQTCAIIGKEVPLDILEEVGQTMGADVERGIMGLCHAELLEPLASGDGHHFTFRHPLIQEVAYRSQLKARRVFVHSAVASVMERTFGGQPGRRSGLIAHHFEAAGQALEAAQYAGKAAQWLSSTDSAQAIKHWRRAHGLAKSSDESARAESLRVMACCQIALLGWREGLSLEDVQPFIDEAMAFADEDDRDLVQLLLLVEGRMLQASGGPADWVAERVRQALSMAQADGDRGRVAMIRAVLSQALGWAGLLDQALDASEAALADISFVSQADHEFVGFSIGQWLHALRSRLFARQGRFDDAYRSIDLLYASGSAEIDPVVAQIAHLCQVDLERFRGDVALAHEHAEHVAELSARRAVPYLRAAAFYCKGFALSVAGRHQGAIEEFSQALAFVRQANVAREYETEILAGLAESHRCVGDIDAALSFAAECIDISKQRSTRLTECRALITAAAARMDRIDSRSANEVPGLLAQAAELVEVTGAQVYRELVDQELTRCASLWGPGIVRADDAAPAR